MTGARPSVLPGRNPGNERRADSTVSSSVAKEGKILAKHSAVYGLGTILNRVVGFIMITIYTRFLTPADYGILE